MIGLGVYVGVAIAITIVCAFLERWGVIDEWEWPGKMPIFVVAGLWPMFFPVLMGIGAISGLRSGLNLLAGRRPKKSPPTLVSIQDSAVRHAMEELERELESRP